MSSRYHLRSRGGRAPSPGASIPGEFQNDNENADVLSRSASPDNSSSVTASVRSASEVRPGLSYSQVAASRIPSPERMAQEVSVVLNNQIKSVSSPMNSTPVGGDVSLSDLTSLSSANTTSEAANTARNDSN